MIDTSLSLLFCQAFTSRMLSNVEDGRGVIQETSRSSSIRSTMLAEFHNTADRALCPSLVASWTVTSKQYCLPELILSWFCRILLPISSMWTCDELKHLGSNTPSIKAALMQSISTSVWGRQDSSHFKLILAQFRTPLLRSFQALV